MAFRIMGSRDWRSRCWWSKVRERVAYSRLTPVFECQLANIALGFAPLLDCTKRWSRRICIVTSSPIVTLIDVISGSGNGGKRIAFQGPYRK